MPEIRPEEDSEVTAAKVSALLATTGVPLLSESRGRLIRAGRRVVTPEMRRRLREIGHEIREMVLRAEGDGHLSFLTRRAVTARAQSLLSPVFEDLESGLSNAAELSARREIASLLRFFRQEDFDLPPRSELRALITTTILSTLAEYASEPFHGMTPAERVSAHQRMAIRRLRQALRRGQESAASVAEVVVAGTSPTNRIGSVVKDARRLGVAERAQVANMAAARFANGLGIAFAYWRLSARHIFRGGEPCETLALSIGPGVISTLSAEGIRPSGVPLRGLKLVSNWPSPPHPNCQCYMEPALFI